MVVLFIFEYIVIVFQRKIIEHFKNLWCTSIKANSFMILGKPFFVARSSKSSTNLKI